MILPGGAHLASLALSSGPAAGLNPLWEVPWPSMDPEAFVPERDLAAYGGEPEGRLLASIMGHNLCLDTFGAPNAAERAAGLTTHGEAPVSTWLAEPVTAGASVTLGVGLPHARLNVRRTYALAARDAVLKVETAVVNAGDALREIGWQEHATFGPPFLEGGVTAFDLPAAWSTSYPAPFARRHRLRTGPGTEFAWPFAPGADGKPVDLRLFPAGAPSGDFTTQLMDPGPEWAWATAVHPGRGLLAGYAWRRADFPWVGNWEEHRDRAAAPWGDRTEARGIEFGVSPFAQGRDAMRALGSLRGTPVLAALAPGGKRITTFYAFLAGVPPGCVGVDGVAVVHGVITVRPRGGGLRRLDLSTNP